MQRSMMQVFVNGSIEAVKLYKTAFDADVLCTYAAEKLKFIADWLNGLKNENGKWDMGKSVNDKVYFPLSNSWRKRETREADCTERII